MHIALDNLAIAKKAPAVFTREPAHFLSSAYSFINTGEVIDVMRAKTARDLANLIIKRCK